MRQLAVIISAGMVLCVFLAGRAFPKTLEEIKAEVREEVKREFGVLPSPKPAPVPIVRDVKPSKTPAGEETVSQKPFYAEIFAGASQETVLISVVSLLLLAFVPATIAALKGRSFLLWWIMGVLFFVITLPVSVLIKNKGKKVSAPGKEAPTRDEKKAPEAPEAKKVKAEGSSAVDIYREIEKLSELKEKGIISEEEFRTKKNQLLDRI